ncbi:MAG: hypothetical protein Q7U04_02155 [Bacteriovorax sp.]|nr:hypothetical protein [Bacteriovorax sp.]
MSNEEKIEKADLGWDDLVIMVCTKCGKQFSDINSQEAPERIKSELKMKAKPLHGSSARIITTSCLNICPVNKIAIVTASSAGSPVFKAFTVAPEISADELYQRIFKK